MEEKYYSAEELAALRKEIEEDTAAAKHEDAHGDRNARRRYQEILDEKSKVWAAEKGKDRDIER